MNIDIELPPLSYFETNNPFTGSHNQTFRFHVGTDDKEIVADIWNEDICFELAQSKEQSRFPLSEEGRLACKAWIEEKCSEIFD